MYIYIAEGNTVGPYKDHFCMGQKNSKKIKNFFKNYVNTLFRGLKCTFSPNMNKKIQKKVDCFNGLIIWSDNLQKIKGHLNQNRVMPITVDGI
jgi:hypothetical protein